MHVGLVIINCGLQFTQWNGHLSLIMPGHIHRLLSGSCSPLRHPLCMPDGGKGDNDTRETQKVKSVLTVLIPSFLQAQRNESIFFVRFTVFIG